MPRQKKQRLKRRKDGRYCCVYHGVQFMGNTDEEALAKREEYKRQEQLDELIRENPTVGQFAERWLKNRSAGIRMATHNAMVTHLKKLCDEIGDLYVREVKPSDIKKVYTTRYTDFSENYIQHAKSLFAALFTSAVDDGIIAVNPALAGGAAPHKGVRGSHRAITAEERNLIETVAVGHRMHAAAIIMLYAGLRPQEVKALRVEDVDFEKGVIHVRSFIHIKSATKYSVDSIGKTGKAIRDVPLFAPVRAALQGKSGFLLADKNGEVATRCAWAKAWRSYKNEIESHINGVSARWYGQSKAQKALKESGQLPPWKSFTVVPYDLRHSFATWCRDNGVELHTCVEWMGHTDAKMILKIYDEVSDTRSQIEAARLEKMLIQMQNNMQAQDSQPQSGINT